MIHHQLVLVIFLFLFVTLFAFVHGVVKLMVPIVLYVDVQF